MSNLVNDRIAENLFERLEELGWAMNTHDYGDKQAHLLRLLATGGFEEASDYVIKLEQDYSGIVSDMQSQDLLDMQGEVINEF